MKHILFALLAATVACSSAQLGSSAKRGIGKGTYLSGPAPTQYLTGGAAPSWKMRNLINETVRVSEKDLVAIAVTPYTQALLETSMRENPTSKQEADLKERSSYYLEETCFMIEVASMEELVARFNKWEGRLQEQGGKVKKIRFHAGTFMKDLPISTKKYFPRYEWENSTLACANKIDLTKPFKVSIAAPGREEGEYLETVVFSWNSD